MENEGEGVNDSQVFGLNDWFKMRQRQLLLREERQRRRLGVMVETTDDQIWFLEELTCSHHSLTTASGKSPNTIAKISEKFCCCSVTQLCPTLCDPTAGLQHARLPCLSPSPRVCSNSCPLSHWCHPLLPPSPPALNLSQHQPCIWGNFFLTLSSLLDFHQFYPQVSSSFLLF